MKDNGFNLENWTTQLRKGLLELCIVNLLHERELYGYDLVKQLTQVSGVVVTEGTIYLLLARLRKVGVLETRLEESPSGPARKYYHLSPRGREAMKLMNLYWRDVVDGVDALLDREEADHD